ncbi:hypothetical protein [Streptomyces sp. NPDC058665]|uniref:hypothetical protein n=1 Tax=Streptomyces sp. NPDC058665 TaxID=3346586 RepID=UPI0036473679
MARDLLLENVLVASSEVLQDVDREVVHVAPMASAAQDFPEPVADLGPDGVFTVAPEGRDIRSRKDVDEIDEVGKVGIVVK